MTLRTPELVKYAGIEIRGKKAVRDKVFEYILPILTVDAVFKGIPLELMASPRP